MSRPLLTSLFPAALLLFCLSIDSTHGQDLTVVTVESKPFIKLVNNEYEGFCVDLLERIASIVGFRYRWKLSDDRRYGTYQSNGTYNGMIQEVADGRADLAVADLTITSGREAVVDFSAPFMNLGISVLYKRPPQSSLTLPYLICVWIGFLTIFLVITGVLSKRLQGTMRVLPTEQMENIREISCSTRILLFSWWLFSVVMVVSFFAVVSLYLTIGFTIEPHLTYSSFSSVEELSLQDNVKFGLLADGSTQSFFQSSNLHVYQKMWQTMSKDPDSFVKSQNELIERVKKGDGKFAALMESATIEYLVSQDCDLVQVGALIDSRGYGIAVRQGSGLRDKINRALLQLQETGVIYRLKEKWWKNEEGKVCPKVDRNEFLEPLRPLLPILLILNFVAFAILALAVIIEVATVFWERRSK